MTYKAVLNLKDKIEATLKAEPKTRDSDHWLAWRIWNKYYQIGENLSWEKYKAVPSDAEIKRLRAAIQNDPDRPMADRYPPTTEAVARERKWNINEWRAALGYDLVLTIQEPK